jgi:hypothetical protein
MSNNASPLLWVPHSGTRDAKPLPTDPRKTGGWYEPLPGEPWDAVSLRNYERWHGRRPGDENLVLKAGSNESEVVQVAPQGRS